MKSLHTFVASALFLSVAAAAHAAEVNSVTYVDGSYLRGSTSLATTYSQPATYDFSAWRLNTGGSYGVSLNNSNWAVGTFLAIGNGGGITLQFDSAIYPVDGQKEFGIFTAQQVNNSNGSYVNGNMDAAILVSQNGTDWYTLTGQLVSNHLTYVAPTGENQKLNAPTVAYDYKNGVDARLAGSGSKVLSSFDIAEYYTPMPNDNLFNGDGIGTQRAALLNSSDPVAYYDVFGTSGGGNWFDISDCGLDSVNFIRINAIDCGGAGIRLSAVFSSFESTIAPIPEPASLSLLLIGGMGLLMRRRK